MKILIIVKKLFPPDGGAELDMIELGKCLAKEHKVFAICYGLQDGSFWYDGISVVQKNIWVSTKESYLKAIIRGIRWVFIIISECRKIQPDMILTQLLFSPIAIAIARKFNIPSILFVKSYEHFCPKGLPKGLECRQNCISCFTSIRERLTYPLLKIKMIFHRLAMKKVNLVISNSYFMKKVCKSLYNVNSVVIYPFMDLNNYVVTQATKKYTLFVNPKEAKGVEIFLKIVESLKTKNFLAVGKCEIKEIEKEINSFSNIKYLHFANNMKEIYNKVKILLVPSILPEGFGRVCVEAMVNGIPCIVSRRGGLPEAVGDAGIIIDDPYNIDNWVNSINRLENDEVLYNELSKKSIEQAKKFDIKYTYKDFVSVVKKMKNANSN